MTRLESDRKEIQFSAHKVFSFLSDFNNFEKLMPEQVVNWESDSESCYFDIKGMTSLGMIYESKTEPTLIKIRDHRKAPFSFHLNCIIEDAGQDKCNLQLIFDADLNPMLKMMAVTPLTNFLNMLVVKFSEISEQNGLEPEPK